MYYESSSDASQKPIPVEHAYNTGSTKYLQWTAVHNALKNVISFHVWPAVDTISLRI